MRTVRQLMNDKACDYYSKLLQKLICFMYATLGTDFLIQVHKQEDQEGTLDLDVQIIQIQPVESENFERLRELMNRDKS